MMAYAGTLHILLFPPRYFMTGYAGTLHVFIEGEEATDVPVWWREGNYGTQWVRAAIDIPQSVFPVENVRRSSYVIFVHFRQPVQ